MPYNPHFTISAQLLSLFEKIERLRERIELATVASSELPGLQREALLLSVHGTTAIEGNPLTVEEVQTVLLGGVPPAASKRSIYEVKNSLAVLKFIERHRGQKVWNEKSILELHRLIGRSGALDRGPVGAFRTYGVRVGHHIPPHAKDVPHLLRELLGWLNGPGQDWPPLVTSAVLHFRFEFIHPFGDGNGRVGRALALWELYRRDFQSRLLFSVDQIYFERRQAYYAALHAAESHRQQDLTSWLEFSADALMTALDRAHMRARRASPLRSEAARTPNQNRLLSLLSKGPLGISSIGKSLGVTKMGAHHILRPLLKEGLIERIGGHRTGVYRVRSPV
jgi:Fic family protein